MPEILTSSPIRGAFRKVRDAVNGNALESRLDAAIAQVRKLEQERQRIIEGIAARFDTSRFDPVVAKARAEFEKERSIESEVHLILMELVAAEVESRVAPVRLARTRARMTGGSTEEWAAFNSQFPMWREALRTACQFSLEAAQREHDRILAEVQAQLGGEFSSEDLANDIRVCKARRVIECWAGAPARCLSEKDGEKLWLSLTGRFCRGT